MGFQVVEVDDGSDLNILASHVAKVLLEEVIGFRVHLRSRADAAGAMERRIGAGAARA